MKAKDFFKSFLGGAGIGTGASIPGVSGATIAVILGVYEKMVWAINNFRKHFKQAILILLPVLLGVLCALLPLIKLFHMAFEGFAFGLVSIFAGFIVGSFPEVTKEVEGKPLKTSYLAALISTCVFVVAIGALSVFAGNKIDISGHFASPEWWFYFVMIPVGMVGAIAFVVPGISGSMTLLVLGFYRPLIDMIDEVISFQASGNRLLQCLGLLTGFLVGLIVGFITIARIVGHLLEKHRTGTFFAIIGFIVGSTITLFFNHEIATYYVEWFEDNTEHHWMSMYLEIIIAAILLLVSGIGSFLLLRLSNKKKEERELLEQLQEERKSELSE